MSHLDRRQRSLDQLVGGQPQAQAFLELRHRLVVLRDQSIERLPLSPWIAADLLTHLR